MSDPSKVEYKAKIARYMFRDLIKEVDGYYYWWPVMTKGCLSAEDLKMIARLLDEANRLWDKQITEYFRQLP